MPPEELEERISLLELKIRGDESKRKGGQKIVDQLVTVSSELERATNAKDSIYTIMRQLELIEEYMDPHFGEEDYLPPAAKLEFINAFEETIYQRNDQLRKIQELQPVLDSEHIRAVPSLTEKLGHLSVLQVEQQEEYCQLAKETKAALEQYNNIIQTLSKLFVQWDEKVTRAEVRKD